MKISPILFDCLEKLRINESVKMNVEAYIFPFAIRATGTCTCTVSAFGVKIIRFQCFDKSEYAFFLPLAV